jgi:hypothetical protein
MTLASVSQGGPREPNYGLLGLTFFVGIYVPTGIVYLLQKISLFGGGLAV